MANKRIFTTTLDERVIKSELIEDYHPDKIASDEIVYFWYDQLDRVIRKVPFDHFFLDTHARELKNRPGVTNLVINFHGDYFNKVDLQEFSDRIIKLGLQRAKNITFISTDEAFNKFAQSHFKQCEINNINFVVIPHMMLHVKENTEQIDVCKKFSIFSRNFRAERLLLFYHLYKKNLLKHANYSFHYRYPYEGTDGIVWTRDDMVSMLTSYLERQKINKNTIEWMDLYGWLNNGPYELKDNYNHIKEDEEDDQEFHNFKNKWSPIVDTNLRESFFNVVVESHYEHTAPGFRYDPKYSYLEFSPTFITEKTYKAIMCQRPFILYAGAFGLRQLRKMGFKTFSPYINESYDDCINDVERMNKIIEEIERLCNLTDIELKDLYGEIFSIAAYNKDLLLKYQNDFKLTWFEDLRDYYKFGIELKAVAKPQPFINST